MAAPQCRGRHLQPARRVDRRTVLAYLEIELRRAGASPPHAAHGFPAATIRPGAVSAVSNPANTRWYPPPRRKIKTTPQPFSGPAYSTTPGRGGHGGQVGGAPGPSRRPGPAAAGVEAGGGRPRHGAVNSWAGRTDPRGPVRRLGPDDGAGRRRRPGQFSQHPGLAGQGLGLVVAATASAVDCCARSVLAAIRLSILARRSATSLSEVKRSSLAAATSRRI